MIRYRSLAAAMAICVATAALTTTPASATHRHHHRQSMARSQPTPDYSTMLPGERMAAQPGNTASSSTPTSHTMSARRYVAYDANANEAQIVPHPAGCPRSLFCGCGAADYLFGRPVRGLWKASAWLGFPRAAPAPRMAAVRSHHVMVLLSQISGSLWSVYDANSGGHQTRIHARDISGYTIVNPSGGNRYAAL